MTNTTIVYRPAAPHEADAIAGFQVAMALETENIALDPPVVARGVASVFERPELGQYFVVESAGRVVGSCLITYEWSDWRCGTVWWIQSLYVEPAARGQRLFRGLYEHLRAVVEADPALRGLRLYVDERNANAQAVYAKLGMNGEHYRVFEWMKDGVAS